MTKATEIEKLNLELSKLKHELYVKPFEEEWKLWGDRQFEIIKIYITQSFTISWAAIVGFIGLFSTGKISINGLAYEAIYFFAAALIFVAIATWLFQYSLDYFANFKEDESNKWTLIAFGTTENPRYQSTSVRKDDVDRIIKSSEHLKYKGECFRNFGMLFLFISNMMFLIGSIKITRHLI